jgi:hypothetical protein
VAYSTNQTIIGVNLLVITLENKRINLIELIERINPLFQVYKEIKDWEFPTTESILLAKKILKDFK